MSEGRKNRGRRAEDLHGARSAPNQSSKDRDEGVQASGWTILAHPLFIAQIEKLLSAAETERSHSSREAGPNTKLLGHILDLVFDKIPRDPGNPAFRHGGALGADGKNWFRGKTGNGRYRLFYRFHSAARIIVFAWVNDENSLRKYGSRSDAYAVFAKMLASGNPPHAWNDLVTAASKPSSIRSLAAVAKRAARKGK